jgi:SpoU rRNA methylase family enzyme
VPPPRMNCEEEKVKVTLIHDEGEQTPREIEIGKTARLATNAAKNEIMQWAEQYSSDADKLTVAICASVQVAVDMLDAAQVLDDEGTMMATVHQIDKQLIPALEKLRAMIGKGAVQ